MKIEITHPAVFYCLRWEELLKDISGFDKFAQNLEKQAFQYGNDNQDAINKYKGWMFEIFVEAFIHYFGPNPNVGIIDYKVEQVDNDTGVDGFGTGINGKVATVQIKYRQGNYLLTANEDRIDRIITASQNRYKVDIQDDKNMLVVTSAKDIDPYTKREMLYGKVRCINREKIKSLVDNHFDFWKSFKNSIGQK